MEQNEQTRSVLRVGKRCVETRTDEMMSEAMSSILTYGFAELGLHRVEAIIDIANERSKSLLLKLGFTYEGNLRQRYSFQGRFEDQHYFGLLKREALDDSGKPGTRLSTIIHIQGQLPD